MRCTADAISTGNVIDLAVELHGSDRYAPPLALGGFEAIEMQNTLNILRSL